MNILNGEWVPHCPNPGLVLEFHLENGFLEITSGQENRIFGYYEKRLEASSEAYYCLDVLFSADGVKDILRSVLCLVEWEQGRGADERCAQEIMSDFSTEGKSIRGRLICCAPYNTQYAKIQLGLRYASNAKIVFSDAAWSQVSPPESRRAKIGVCQWNPSKSGGKDDYLTQLEGLLQGAGEAGCDLMLLPEFCDTYEWKENFLSAGPLTENITVCTASGYAKKYKMYVVVPVVERDGNHVFNTSAILSRDGSLAGKYRKTHLYWPEACSWSLTPGDEFPVFKLDFGIIGIETCYDNWNADVCKLLALKGAELILMPNEGYDPLIIPARAVDNRVYLAVSSLAFEGVIYNARGEKIGKGQGPIQTCEIDLNERVPPFPVAGGSCNYAMGARRSMHNSISDRLYQELLNEINKWQNINESFMDMRGDISGELNR
ncbi:MAG: carbon-nitrogen hydrolase family protein [Treponema sp.]|jgi:predicted amidohydrolase|nr:carbon-nitrogen hydrolase family protein [Treponema sp.]